MKHSDVIGEIRAWAGINGWQCITIAAGPFSQKGIADRVILKDNRYVWVEAKTKTDTLSRFQRSFQKDIIEASGGEYMVVRRYEDLEVLKTCKHLKEVQSDYAISTDNGMAAYIYKRGRSPRGASKKEAK